MYQYRFASDPRNLGKEIKLKKMGGGIIPSWMQLYTSLLGVCVWREGGIKYIDKSTLLNNFKHFAGWPYIPLSDYCFFLLYFAFFYLIVFISR